MKVYKTMCQTEQWIWLHSQIQMFPYICYMKIKFRDNGEIIEVNTADELVTYMNKTSFTPAINNSEYMKEYARRSVISADEDIRATSVLEFVEDLLKMEHIYLIDGILPN